MTDDEIRGDVSQGLRWMTAGLQDRHPVVAHLHLAYATERFMSLLEKVTETRVRQVTRVDVRRALKQASRRLHPLQRRLLGRVGPPVPLAGVTARSLAPRAGVGLCGLPGC